MQDALNKLRLSEEELRAVVELAKDIFGEGLRLWIFGSRADKTRKGGDIDIYIELPSLENVFDKEIKYLSKLKLSIEDQKIDLVVRPYDCDEDICLEAKNKGVRVI